MVVTISRRWVAVSPADCPPAFHDPTFKLHKSFCSDEINPGLASMYGTALEEVDFHQQQKHLKSAGVDSP